MRTFEYLFLDEELVDGLAEQVGVAVDLVARVEPLHFVTV